MTSSSYSTTLPSVGPPMSSWSMSSPSSRRSCVRDKRQQKLGLWSAVALQQHFTTTGGQRCRPLPFKAGCLTAEEEDGLQHSGVNRRSSVDGGDATNDGALTSVNDLRTHLGPTGSVPGHPHKPTLAQRMGLVPAPPPAPTAEDWQVVVHRAMLREQQRSRAYFYNSTNNGGDQASASVCAICQMSFLSTIGEGQVILSCSHIFHAQCFRAFERCVRAQQRADGAGIMEITTQLACPVCRTQHYYKRVFYEGKAMTQRAAIVKVQSAIRGFLARRRYVQQRLRNNTAFRTKYVQERLARLSSAWTAFCAQQERHRETTLTVLRVQHQAATAAYLTEDEWSRIWHTVVQKAKGTCSSDRGSPGLMGAVERESAVIYCPICLERIWETYFTQRQCALEKEASHSPGDDTVAALRLAYKARQKARQEINSSADEQKSGKKVSSKKKAQTDNSKHASPPPAVSKNPKTRLTSRQQQKPLAGQLVETAADVSVPPATQLPSLPPSTSYPSSVASGPRYGVLLSCGHCFHATCIGCYEHFNEQRVTESTNSNQTSTVVVADRCPICRAGYAKHPL